MKLPWNYKNGVEYSRVLYIRGKKRLCITTAFPVTFLTWLGLYPDSGPFWRRVLKKIIGYFALLLSVYQFFATTSHTIMYIGEFEKMGQTFYLILICSHAIISQVLLRISGEEFGIIIETIENNLGAWPTREPENFAEPKEADDVRKEKELDHPSELNPHPGEAVVTKTLIKNNILLFSYWAYSMFCAICYSFIPIIKPHEEGVRLLPHDGYFIINSQITPLYEILYFIMSITALVNGLYIPVIDMIACNFINFISAHYQALQLRLESMHTASDNFNFRVELIKCIVHHKKIKDLAEYAENTFNKFFLYIYLLYLLLIGFILIRFFKGDELSTVEKITIFNVMMISLINLFIICYFCQIVTDQSTMVPFSLYQCDWVHTSRENRILVYIFYSGITKPIYFTTGKFASITLDIWVQIIKAGYSLYTLFEQV